MLVARSTTSFFAKRLDVSTGFLSSWVRCWGTTPNEGILALVLGEVTNKEHHFWGSNDAPYYYISAPAMGDPGIIVTCASYLSRITSK